MQYFELDELYPEVPPWVSVALSIGYQWGGGERNPRRIGLLSMPCESEAAGLIALGALRKDLERSNANHVDSHFELLLEKCHLTQRSSEFNEECDWDVISADGTRCRFVEYNADFDAIVVEKTNYRETVRRKGIRLTNRNGPGRHYIMRNSASEWQLRGYAVPKSCLNELKLNYSDYKHLPNCDGVILEENLSCSYEGVTLFGNGVAQDSSYIQKFYRSGFYRDGRCLYLGDLLTFPKSYRGIRRLRFLADRTKTNHEVYPGNLVIADGIAALLRADILFPDRDIIGVCCREVSDGTLLQLKEFLSDKARYYNDIDAGGLLSCDMPEGMLLRMWQRKI